MALLHGYGKSTLGAGTLAGRANYGSSRDRPARPAPGIGPAAAQAAEADLRAAEVADAAAGGARAAELRGLWAELRAQRQRDRQADRGVWGRVFAPPPS